jgi:hypothetical protein
MYNYLKINGYKPHENWLKYLTRTIIHTEDSQGLMNN